MDTAIQKFIINKGLGNIDKIRLLSGLPVPGWSVGLIVAPLVVFRCRLLLLSFRDWLVGFGYRRTGITMIVRNSFLIGCRLSLLT